MSGENMTLLKGAEPATPAIGIRRLGRMFVSIERWHLNALLLR
jgi:hypothetical protein